MRLLLLCAALFLMTSCGTDEVTSSQLQVSECASFDLPDEVTFKRKVFSWGMGYKLYDSEGSRIAQIKEKWFTWGKTLALYDAEGNKVAEGKNRPFVFGRKIRVKDCQGNILGGLHQSFLNKAGEEAFDGRFARYSIVNNERQRIAVSEKSRIFKTRIRFFDRAGNLQVSLKRGGFFVEKWYAAQSPNSRLDDRLWVFMAPFQQSIEEERKAREENERSEEEFDDQPEDV